MGLNNRKWTTFIVILTLMIGGPAFVLWTLISIEFLKGDWNGLKNESTLLQVLFLMVVFEYLALLSTAFVIYCRIIGKENKAPPWNGRIFKVLTSIALVLILIAWVYELTVFLFLN